MTYNVFGLSLNLAQQSALMQRIFNEKGGNCNALQLELPDVVPVVSDLIMRYIV